LLLLLLFVVRLVLIIAIIYAENSVIFWKLSV